MANPLTREAVLAAVAEHDKFGEPAFLARYGAGPALEYFLMLDGKLYASKAIVRAALMALNGGVRQRMAPGARGVVPALQSLGFDVLRLPKQDRADDSKIAKDVKWTWDEHVLALELYLESYPRLPGPDAGSVTRLSRWLNRLGAINRVLRSEKYRNPEGVSMKLGNFRRHDKRYTRQTRKNSAGDMVEKVGLTRGAGGEKQVWDRYADDQDDLKMAAEAIRALIVEAEQNPGADVFDPLEDPGVPEGALKLRLHKIRERNPQLVRDKLDQVFQETGALKCEACDFDFSAIYGRLGAGFLEVHHRFPIARYEPGQKTTLADLAVVCPNCHRMLHRDALISVEELKLIISQHR